MALAALQIRQQMVQTLDQVLTLGVEGALKNLGVGGGEIRRRQGVDPLPGIEGDLFPRLGVQAVDIADRVADPVRRQQVGLLQGVEQDVFRPGLILEPLVVRGGRGHRGGVLPIQALGRGIEQDGIALPQFRLRFGQLGRVLQHGGTQFEKRLADHQRVRNLKSMLFRLTVPEPLHDALAAFVQRLGRALRLFRVRERRSLITFLGLDTGR